MYNFSYLDSSRFRIYNKFSIQGTSEPTFQTLVRLYLNQIMEVLYDNSKVFTKVLLYTKTVFFCFLPSAVQLPFSVHFNHFNSYRRLRPRYIYFVDFNLRIFMLKRQVSRDAHCTRLETISVNPFSTTVLQSNCYSKHMEELQQFPLMMYLTLSLKDSTLQPGHPGHTSRTGRSSIDHPILLI